MGAKVDTLVGIYVSATGERMEAMSMSMPPELFEEVRRRIKGLKGKAARERRLYEMEEEQSTDNVDAAWVLEWIVLGQAVSIPLAWHMFLEALADGSLPALSRRTEGGPLERVPPEMFRGRLS